jgi:hypothetical protein
MEVLNKFIDFIKVKWGFFKMNVFYDVRNLEYRVRRLERSKYWKEKYRK